MAQKKTLFGDSDSEDVEFTINKDYADHYQTFRQKEELQKLKDLQKEISSESSSESESEDEPVVADKDFLVTLSLLKGKDPRIYDDNYTFYNKNDEEKPKPKEKKEKPMFMKDYERKMILERNGKFSSDEEEEDDSSNKPSTSKGPAFPEEIEAVTKDFLKAAYSDDDEKDDADSKFGGLFEVRKKTKDEEEEEKEEHIKWLKGQEANVDEKTKKDLKYLREFWNDPNIDEDEKFLRDFILDQKNIVKDDAVTVNDIAELDEEEKVQEQQELFEHKYNFRFEEPDQEFIKRYPRTIGDSLRREDTRRKQTREEYTERKKKEKEQMREELKRLKAIKRKEIEDRFIKLKEASGKEELNFDESDMESDFDPDKHDKKMREMFDDDYYGVEEEQKPEFEFDEEIDDVDWDHWKREDTSSSKVKKEVASSGEDSDPGEGTSSATVDRKLKVEQDILESTRRRKGRKKSLFAKIVSEPKPLYDPDGKSFDEYLDEYYKLDFEDVIGDQPVRFKYRKVIPNDFGLSVDEILTAHDKELNRWCSIKKTCQYRRDEEEQYDVQAFRRKAENVAVKQKVLHSVYAPPDEEEETPEQATDTASSAKKKRRRKKKKGQQTIDELQEDDSQSVKPVEEDKINVNVEETEDRLLEGNSQSDNARKRKRKKKNIDKTNGAVQEKIPQSYQFSDSSDKEVKTEVEDDTSSAKKRKRNKKKNDDQQTNDLIYEDIPKPNELSVTPAEEVKSEVKDETSSAKKRKRNKKKKAQQTNDHVQNTSSSNTETFKPNSKQNHKRKRSGGFNENFKSEADKRLQISNDRLAAFGINPKKFKNSYIYSKN